LENIASNETFLRNSLHFELTNAYSEKDLLQESNNQIKRALMLDYSIVNNLKSENTGKIKNKILINRTSEYNYINR
jgi:hypothetical protein